VISLIRISLVKFSLQFSSPSRIHMSQQFYPSWFHHTNNIRRWAGIRKVPYYVVFSGPTSFSHSSKFPPRHALFKHRPSSHTMNGQVTDPYKTTIIRGKLNKLIM
jgi:hypothetical protein